MRLPALCLVTVLLGCSGERVSQSVVRDSADIRIVEHNTPDWSSLSWSLADSPTVAIGTMDGEEPYQLHTVSDAARAGNGQILILNTSTAEVRVFDANGRYLRSIGRTDAAVRWTVYDPQGALAGIIETGRNLKLTEVGADYVLGVQRDENDVERVVLYRLRKS